MNSWVARNLVYRPATWLRGEPVFSLLHRFEQSQWDPPEAIQARQELALRDLLRFAARNAPFYAEQARAAGLEPEQLKASDVGSFSLRKRDLVEHLSSLSTPRLRGTYSWKTTGGSTGVPVRLRKNRFATATEQAASWRSYGWYGISPGDRQARFWGTPITGAGRWRARAIDGVLNRERFSAFAFTRRELREYFERLRERRPAWAYGYVSMLRQFASFCLEEALPLHELGVRAVVTTSEVLTPGDRDEISRAFGAPVFNEYGCGEVGAVLYECDRGSLHLMAENLLAELDPDPTPDAPDAHRLILTDLHNRATPLIRYDVGDRVVPAPPCACGRGLPAFREVFGRAYDFVTAGDGTQYHGEFFLYHLEQARDIGAPIRQAQFVQQSADRLLLRIVGGPGYRDETGRELARRIETSSQGRFRIEATAVGEIERERSGKIRLIKALSTEAS